MKKTLDIRFEAVACFSVRLEVDADQYNKIKALCERESPFLVDGDPLHTLLMDAATSSRENYDYIDKDADIENIEFDDLVGL